MRFLYLILGFIYVLGAQSYAQKPDTGYIIVAAFEFEGNQHTKPVVLKRDLTFGIGDTLWLKDIEAVLETNRLRLMNLGIFRRAALDCVPMVAQGGPQVVVRIKVLESWYIYPMPIFELADRNFNIWWTDGKRDLRRTNYGIRLLYNNLSGYNDPLTALVQGGYTPKISLSYQFPFLNRSQRVGLSGYLFYAQNREIGYKTTHNRLEFTPDLQRNLLKRWQSYLTLSYRPELFGTHAFTLGYSQQRIDTAIATRYNPDYFLDGRARQAYFWAYYAWAHDNRDNRPYPTQGHLIQFYLSKLGLWRRDAVNTWDIYAKWSQYGRLSARLSWEAVAKGRTNLTRQPLPYNLQRAFGYGTDFIRGYEYYVVDGLDYVYLKNTLRYRIWEKDVHFPSKFGIKALSSFKTMPIRAYLTAHADGGYVSNPYAEASNTFANRWLGGWGAGLHIVAYYNIVWMLEYSINQATQQGGFFLSYRGSL